MRQRSDLVSESRLLPALPCLCGEGDRRTAPLRHLAPRLPCATFWAYRDGRRVLPAHRPSPASDGQETHGREHSGRVDFLAAAVLRSPPGGQWLLPACF